MLRKNYGGEGWTGKKQEFLTAIFPRRASSCNFPALFEDKSLLCRIRQMAARML
jgi:hypothetical protein